MTAPQNVTYIALKPLKVGKGMRQPGEEVPEARSWRNVQAYVNRSMLAIKVLDPEQVKGGVDTRAQAGRAESSRPKHKPVHANQAPDDSRPEVSSGADLDKLKAPQLIKGIEEGSLTAKQVSDYERERESPRKTVLRAAGWEDHEIKQGYLDSEEEPEPEPIPENSKYEDLTDEQLVDAWYARYGENDTAPDDREGLIADLEAEDEDDEVDR